MNLKIDRTKLIRTWAIALIVTGTLLSPLALQAPSGAVGTTWANVAPAQFGGGIQSSSPNANFNSVSCSSLTCVAVGTFQDASGNNQAVTASSNDGGVTWSVAQPATVPVGVAPAGSPDATFTSVSCSGSTCVASGDFYAQFGLNTAMFAASSDGGLTWAPVQAATFASGVESTLTPESGFNSVSCSGSTCVAVGDVYTSEFIPQAMTETSTNGGATWSPAQLANVPIGDINATSPYSDFTAVSCTGATCVAVGFYFNVANSYSAMTLTSIDGGVTWASAQTATLPLGVQAPNPESVFVSVSCSGTTCVAVGRFSTPVSSYGAMTATSSDGGLTWATAQVVNFPSGVEYTSNNPEFNSVSCSGAICVGAGWFLASSAGPEPFTVTSSDGGLTWATAQPATFASGVQATPPDARFNAVSCSSMTCVAAGSFVDGNGNSEAMTQTSTDGGLTWATVQPATFASGVQSASPAASFNAVSCSSSTCVTAGEFSDVNANTEAMVDSDIVPSSLTKVTNLDVVQIGSTLSASWTRSAGATSYTCTLMFGFMTPSNFTSTTTSPTCSFTGLNATTPYGVAVVANGPDGESASVTSFGALMPTTTTTIHAKPRPVVRTIVCVRAKKVKRVRGIHPRCPAGYKKR